MSLRHRLAIPLLLLGSILLLFLMVEGSRSFGVEKEPTPCTLEQLERGEDPPGRHITLGGHWALEGGALYSYRERDGEPGPNDPILDATYPVISKEHPTAKAWDALQKEFGSLEKIPEERAPAMEPFRVVVFTKRFETLGELSEGWVWREKLQGVLKRPGKGLSDEDVRLLRESFCDFAPERVLVLEEGREPTALSTLVLLLVCSVGSLILGLLSMRGRQRTRLAELREFGQD